MSDTAFVNFGVHFDNPAMITIGDDTHINKYTKFYTGDPLIAKIMIGNKVDIGQDVKFVCASHVIGGVTVLVQVSRHILEL